MKLNEELLMESVKNATETTYLTHNYHPFPAKFIPHIPQILIQQFSKPGDRVFDPFCGSGTTLIESTLLGRSSIGTDINPISVLASKVKTTQLSPEEIELIEKCITTLQGLDPKADYSRHIPEFHGRDHWFMAHVQNELAMLRSTIINLTKPESNTRLFLDLALSSIVNLVSNQDSDTRYAAVEKDVPVGIVCLGHPPIESRVCLEHLVVTHVPMIAFGHVGHFATDHCICFLSGPSENRHAATRNGDVRIQHICIGFGSTVSDLSEGVSRSPSGKSDRTSGYHIDV